MVQSPTVDVSRWLMCDTLEGSTPGYYSRFQRKPGPRAQRGERPRQTVRQICDEHHGVCGSAFMLRFESGAVAAGCHHNSCGGKEWDDLRAMHEPKPGGRKGRSQADDRVALAEGVDLFHADAGGDPEGFACLMVEDRREV